MNYSELDVQRYTIYVEFPLRQEHTDDFKLHADELGRTSGNPSEGEKDDYHSKS